MMQLSINLVMSIDNHDVQFFHCLLSIDLQFLCPLHVGNGTLQTLHQHVFAI